MQDDEKEKKNIRVLLTEPSLTSVCTSWQRWFRIRDTKLKTSTLPSACIIFIMASITMNVPVLPTPALEI